MLKSLLLIVLTVLINTIGQFMVKTGVNRVGAVSLPGRTRDHPGAHVVRSSSAVSSSIFSVRSSGSAFSRRRISAGRFRF